MAELLATEPLTIGGLLDQVFRQTTASFRPVMPYALIGAAGSLSVNFLQYGSKIGAALSIDWLAQPGPALYAIAWLLGLGAYGYVILAHLAGVVRVYEVANATPPPSAAWERARARFRPAIGMGLLAGIALLIPGAIAGATIGGLWRAGMFAAALLAGIVLLVAFLYVACRLIVCLPELLLARRGIKASLSGSWRLTRGQMTRLSVVFAVTFAISLVGYVVIATPVALVLGLVVRLTGAPPLLLTALVTLVVAPLISVLATPFGGAVSVSLWNDLRLRSEGHDLDAKIDSLAEGA